KSGSDSKPPVCAARPAFPPFDDGAENSTPATNCGSASMLLPRSIPTNEPQPAPLPPEWATRLEIMEVVASPALKTDADAEPVTPSTLLFQIITLASSV